MRRLFFRLGKVFRESLDVVLEAFLLNVRIFLIAWKGADLVFALVIAILRSLPGPVFFPVRALAVAYADFFLAPYHPPSPPPWVC